MNTYTVNLPFFRREVISWPRELHPRDTITLDGKEYLVNERHGDQVWATPKR